MSNVPNLDDGLDPDELLLFYRTHRKGLAYLTLFPDDPPGSQAACVLLSKYAHAKAAAKRCRLRGDIAFARQFESACERIYRRLPAFARW